MRQPQGMYRCSSVASKGRARRRVCRAPRCRPSTGRIPDRDRTFWGVAVPVVSGARGRRGDPLTPVPPGHPATRQWTNSGHRISDIAIRYRRRAPGGTRTRPLAAVNAFGSQSRK